MMRQRHLAFSIDENARQIWLNCFRKILIQSDVKYGFPLEHVEDFWQFLEEFSAWMVNTQ
jgi:hemoglobin